MSLILMGKVPMGTGDAYQIEKGLLINFGPASLETKRPFRKH